MDVALALLADYANTTAEGKLNILGVFDTVFAGQFPAVHSQMSLILRLEANRAEAGQRKTLEIRLMRPDGGEDALSIKAEVQLPSGHELKIPPGEPIRADNILGLSNVVFESPGCAGASIQPLPRGQNPGSSSSSGPSPHSQAGDEEGLSHRPQGFPPTQLAQLRTLPELARFQISRGKAPTVAGSR